MKMIKFSPSTTDTAIVATARLQYIRDLGRDDMLGFVFGILIHIFAFITQIVIVLVFRSSVVQTKIDALEGAAFDAVVANLQNQTYKDLVIAGTVVAPPQCAANDSHVYLHYMMLFLWLAQIGPDLWNNVWRMFIVGRIKHEPAIEDDEDEYPRDPEITKDGFALKHISLPCKLFVFFFILLPHFVVLLYTTWVGMKYIATEGDVGMVLMKALVLGMIATVDNTLWTNFAAKNLQGYIKSENSGYKVPKDKPTAFNKAWDSWFSTVFKVGLFIAIAVAYYHVVWADSIHFRQLCHALMEEYKTAKADFSSQTDLYCDFKDIPGNSCGGLGAKDFFAAR